MAFLKNIASRLPGQWQSELKRVRYARQIRKGTFQTDEPEYLMLSQLVSPGDWVLDIGANVGHYTKRFSELAGARGRVIAFEPVPTTFSLLSANAQHFAHPNVSLINDAVSGHYAEAGMSIPRFSSGLHNFYEAHLSPGTENSLPVLALSIDSLAIDHPISLVKIDAEDHEASVLAGMKNLIEKHHPTLIVETGSQEVVSALSASGYAATKLPGSPNFLFRANR